MKEIQEITGYKSRPKTLCFCRHLSETYSSFQFETGGKTTQAAKLIYLPNIPDRFKKGVE